MKSGKNHRRQLDLRPHSVVAHSQTLGSLLPLLAHTMHTYPLQTMYLATSEPHNPSLVWVTQSPNSEQ